VNPLGSRWAARAGAWLGAALIAVSLAACGEGRTAIGDQPDLVGRAEATFPVTVAAANGEVTIEERPERIVSLSATATEMLFAIGAGDQVVAVDDQSDFPADAPITELSGFDVNVEALASYAPDLVVYSTDPGGLEKSLRKLEITSLSQVAAVTIDDTYAQIEQLGEVTGRVQQAELVVGRIEAEIDDIMSSLPEFEDPPTYYHELDTNYFTVTSETFIGEVYSMLGLQNIADEADEDKTGYPQLSAEYILDADPDLIFLADTKCCDQNGETVARRPGWGQIEAVRNDAVVELDDDVASRWGPRVVDFLRIAADAVARLDGTA